MIAGVFREIRGEIQGGGGTSHRTIIESCTNTIVYGAHLISGSQKWTWFYCGRLWKFTGPIYSCLQETAQMLEAPTARLTHWIEAGSTLVQRHGRWTSVEPESILSLWGSCYLFQSIYLGDKTGMRRSSFGWESLSSSPIVGLLQLSVKRMFLRWHCYLDLAHTHRIVHLF